VHGGFRAGSGRPGREIKVEDCLRLSVLVLQRRGLLDKPWRGQWLWKSSTSRNANSKIELASTPKAVHLSFVCHGRPVKQELVLAHVANNFGGSRIYFTCPRCCSRRRDVYFLDGLFLCRDCHDLPYQSQSEGRIDRMWNKEGRFERKLGPRRTKPKGMHQSTFQQLQEKLFELEERREKEILVLLDEFDENNQKTLSD
jgi:hypothetical protein